MISFIGAVFLALIIGAIALRRSAIPWVLAGAAPFSTTAAISVAGNSIPPFHVVAILLIPTTLVALLTRANQYIPRSLIALALFAAWALVITIVAPRYFQGLEVLDPRAGIDDQVFTPTPLSFNMGNVAQLGYLALAVVAVLAIIQAGRPSPHLVGVSLATGSLLSAFRLVLGNAWPTAVFENYENVGYWETAFAGSTRHRGIYSEPSYLAVLSLATVAFSVVMVLRTSGRIQVLYLALAAIGTVNLVLTFSGTAVMGALAIGVLLSAIGLWHVLVRRAKVPLPLGLGVLVALSAGVTLVPILAKGILDLIEEKTSSQSFFNRTASDLMSLDITAQTWGLGVGLGSNRPSSFITMLLSTVGVPGLLLFIVLIGFSILTLQRAGSMFQPTLWALLAVLIAKMIADPALSTPIMWLCLAVGIACSGSSEEPPPQDSFRGIMDAAVPLDERTSQSVIVARSTSGGPLHGRRRNTDDRYRHRHL